MYKITLYDYCCNPICDGTESFFVDNLEDFEKNWKPLVKDEERIKKYEKSKNGEVITDYYSDDENLNIVQMDSNSKVIDEVEYEKTNFDIDLYNAYNCSSKYYIFSLKYKLRKIAFKGDYYIIAKYKITGIAEYTWLSRNESDKYENASFYGNPVCNVKYSDESFEYYPTTEPFKEDTIDSFVWHIVWNRKDNVVLDELNEEELQYLLRDIIGEAG